MAPQESPEAINRKNLEERIASIGDAIGTIADNIAKDGKGELAPAEQATVNSIATLAYCGLVALTEIADAQQRMAAISEADFEAAVAQAADGQAEVKAEAIVKERGSRNFLGKGADRS